MFKKIYIMRFNLGQRHGRGVHGRGDYILENKLVAVRKEKNFDKRSERIEC